MLEMWVSASKGQSYLSCPLSIFLLSGNGVESTWFQNQPATKCGNWGTGSCALIQTHTHTHTTYTHTTYTHTPYTHTTHTHNTLQHTHNIHTHIPHTHIQHTHNTHTHNTYNIYTHNTYTHITHTHNTWHIHTQGWVFLGQMKNEARTSELPK